MSIASNTASAVASAYTNVINDTNVLQDQNVVQAQSVTLENCAITAKKDIKMQMSTHMNQSMQQIANVTNDTTIANSIAQALSQAATSSVGVGVIGIADSNNQASTYANMSTNVSNYVTFSSKQNSTAQQSFTCQNSTIISQDGGFNLSMQETGDVTQYQKDSVMNQTKVTNTITQTIQQTATASTGMSWWVVLAIAVVAIVFGIIFKLKDAKSKATRAIDMQQAIELGCCTKAELNITGGGVGSFMKSVGSYLNKGVTAFTNGLNRIGASSQVVQSNACAGCDCYKLAHPEAHISTATVIIYVVGLFLIGGLIGIWYAFAMGRGCLFDDACGTNGGSNFNGMMAGCSCQFELAGDGDQVCKDSLHATFSSNGLPLKYQYPLFVHAQKSNGCNDAQNFGPASMQGVLVQALATISPTSNSNNGKNMDTINNYFGFMTPPTELSYISSQDSAHSTSLYYLFLAAADYICEQHNKHDDYDLLYQVMNFDGQGCSSKGTQNTKGAHRLYAFLCPLRPVFVNAPCSSSSSSGTLNAPTLLDETKIDTLPSLTGLRTVTDFGGYVPNMLGTNPSNQCVTSPLSGNLLWPILDSTPATQVMAVKVPPAFRYGADDAGIDPTGDDDNKYWSMSAGCCSLHTMKYMSKDNPGGLTPMDFSCDCSDPNPNSTVTKGTEQAAMVFCSGGSDRCIDGKCSDGSTCQGTGACAQTQTSSVYHPENEAETMLLLPVCGTPNGSCNQSTMYTEVDKVGTWLPYYAEWTTFDCDLKEGNDNLCSLIRLLWAGTLSYIKGTSSDTVFGINSALKTPQQSNKPDHYYVTNVKGGAVWGVIGDTTTTSEATIDDPTRLNIELVESAGYDVRLGFPQTGCTTNTTSIAGQGYTASATALGYCRSRFFNRITLYTIIGILIFWALTLPVFIIIRWYVNKDTSSRYLAAANAQGKKRRRIGAAQQNTQNTQNTQPDTTVTNTGNSVQEGSASTSPAKQEEAESLGSFDNGSAGSDEIDDGQKGMELGGVSDKMKRDAQNRQLNDEDMAQAEQNARVEAQTNQAPNPTPEPKPQQPAQLQTHNDEGESVDPLMGVVPDNMKGGRKKRKRLIFRH